MPFAFLFGLYVPFSLDYNYIDGLQRSIQYNFLVHGGCQEKQSGV